MRLPPNDARGRPTRTVRIDRPLDFAAVTDHAEFLGETRLCADPDSPVYDARACVVMRTERGRAPTFAMHIMSPITWRKDSLCGDDGSLCYEAAGAAWGEIIGAAEAWNDTSSACARTTFIAYEYSSHRLGSNLHRNVVFRNAAVPRRPISYIETPREWELWEWLRDLCLDSETGCDALAIPHNSNISNGRMFPVDWAGAPTQQAQVERARLRMRLEPVVEVMQHKGDSECHPAMEALFGSSDEECGFEKFEDWAPGLLVPASERGECGAGDWRIRFGPTCYSPGSYARTSLTRGLAEEARIGVNPFKFGLVASTDTHNALAGGVEERSFPGHLGVGDDSAAKRSSLDRAVEGNASNGPGGLVAVWAPENSRDALFDAIRDKEVYGTSGPRIVVRFFGTRDADWDRGESLCTAGDLVARGYAQGVAMGGDLPIEGDAAPLFAVSALRDVGTATAPGNGLERVQIVKGWLDDDGAMHQRVYDVAGAPAPGPAVDPETCAPRVAGHASLCSVWRDPDFDARERAYYYARVLEVPSCRYTAWQCLEVPAAARGAACAADSPIPRTQRERAWTSPIWYTPPSDATGAAVAASG